MKTKILVCLLVAATAASGADWVYDSTAGTVSDGVWTFAASLSSGGKLQVSQVKNGPDVLTPLDFSKPVTDGNGTSLYFNHFWRTFYTTYVDKRSVVGELTLPSDGYTTLTESFGGCANATGTIVLAASLGSTGLGGGVFSGCKKLVIVGSSIPQTATVIQPSTFKECKIQGDVELSGVQTIHNNAFVGSNIGSVSFGLSLTSLGTQNSDRDGPFMNCTSLTNVTFDSASTVTICGARLFYGCSALEELDLTAVARIELTGNSNNHAHFCNCSALRKITFGSKLNYLDGRAFYGASALSKVFFEGPPPATIENAYLYGIGNRRVTTYVVLDPSATDYDYATAKAQWDALTAGGAINETDSAWKTDLVGGVAAEYRPLILYSVSHASIAATRDADEGEGVIGLFTVSRGDGDSTAADLVVNYTVGGTAVAGQTYGALTGSVTIPAGETSATIEVVPLDDPLTASNTTVTVTLSVGDYDIVAGHGTATMDVVNGASFPGWKYTITGNNAGTLTRGDWSFAATHSGRNLTVEAVTAWPADVAPLDFSPIVVGSDGVAYTIVKLDTKGFNGSGLNVTSEAGSRVGLLTLPDEGLATIGDNAFIGCTNAFGSLVFPSTLTTIGSAAFAKTQISGDLTFPSLKSMPATTFMNTRITSVAFGPNLAIISGGWARGAFYGCSSLTNVVFDPASRVSLGFQGYIFCYCSSLTDFDLSCVTNIVYSFGPGSNGNLVGVNFSGCTSLTNLTFGTGLAELPADTFSGMSALQTIHFKGPAPAIGAAGQNAGDKLFKGIGANQTVKTYVRLQMAENGKFGQSWTSYADGAMNTVNSKWKSSLLASGDNANFYLLLEDAPLPTLILIK